MSRITYKTLRSGLIELTQANVIWIPYLSVKDEAQLRDRILFPFTSEFNEHSARTGVPFAWGVAVSWATSRGSLSQAEESLFSTLSTILKLEQAHVGAADLVRVAAAYHYGSIVPTSDSPWGLTTHSPVYLMNVVSANNTTIRALGATDPNMSADGPEGPA